MRPDLTACLQAALAQPAPPSSDHDLNPDFTPQADRVLRPAAVLIAIQVTDQGPALWLTKRASHLRHHPGQIAFPGGRQDAGDPDLTFTALREATEEIGLPASIVQPLGLLSPHETVTGFQVTPVLGLVTRPFTPRLDPAEVAELFPVPLAHALNPARFAIERRRWRGAWRNYYTVPYGPYYIWGATARILRGLADRWQE
jgi:8-oxo-dGTP pyrophosphatase MutT (NUDIX family)